MHLDATQNPIIRLRGICEMSEDRSRAEYNSGRNGYDVIVEAKRKGAVKAVAISGFAARDDVERGRKAGFDFHLAKPVDFHELRSVLGQIAA